MPDWAVIWGIVVPMVLGAGQLAKNPAFGGLWEKLPKWARPAFFAIVALVGSVAGAAQTGLPIGEAIAQGAMAWLTADKGFGTVSGIAEERQIKAAANAAHRSKKEVRGFSRDLTKAGDMLGGIIKHLEGRTGGNLN